jgi:hypothetical protein
VASLLVDARFVKNQQNAPLDWCLIACLVRIKLFGGLGPPLCGGPHPRAALNAFLYIFHLPLTFELGLKYFDGGRRGLGVSGEAHYCRNLSPDFVKTGCNSHALSCHAQGPELPVPRLTLGRLLSWKRPSVFQEIQTGTSFSIVKMFDERESERERERETERDRDRDRDIYIYIYTYIFLGSYGLRRDSTKTLLCDVNLALTGPEKGVVRYLWLLWGQRYGLRAASHRLAYRPPGIWPPAGRNWCFLVPNALCAADLRP